MSDRGPSAGASIRRDMPDRHVAPSGNGALPHDDEAAARDEGGRSASMTGSQVVDRVVDILELFARVGPELGVSEVSRALDLKKATTHRLLTSLLRRGLLAQDAVTRRYRLGIKLWELGALVTNSVDWSGRAKPHLERLTSATGETTHLAILSDGQVLYVDKVEGAHSLRMPSQVGRRLPVHCTGVGKALVAFLPDEALKSIVARHGLPRMTTHTITDLAMLRDDLALVRERGYSVDHEEIEEGLTCIAAPVRDHTSHVVAAVSTAGPTSRLEPRIDQYSETVVEVARNISLALGCPEEVLPPRRSTGATRA